MSILLTCLAYTCSQLVSYLGTMKKSASGKPVADKPTSKDSGSRSKPDIVPPPQVWVIREIADTTWRMTVPVVIFTFIGIFCDIKFHTKPWLTFLGVVIGFYFAIVLIKQQINRSQDQP